MRGQASLDDARCYEMTITGERGAKVNEKSDAVAKRQFLALFISRERKGVKKIYKNQKRMERYFGSVFGF